MSVYYLQEFTGSLIPRFFLSFEHLVPYFIGHVFSFSQVLEDSRSPILLLFFSLLVNTGSLKKAYTSPCE